MSIDFWGKTYSIALRVNEKKGAVPRVTALERRGKAKTRPPMM